jgi:hypothetical protein
VTVVTPIFNVDMIMDIFPLPAKLLGNIDKKWRDG